MMLNYLVAMEKETILKPKITAILTSYLFLQLRVAFLNSSFKSLSSQFLCSGGFLERFFVLGRLLRQRCDGPFKIINLHLLFSYGPLKSLKNHKYMVYHYMFLQEQLI